MLALPQSLPPNPVSGIEGGRAKAYRSEAVAPRKLFNRHFFARHLRNRLTLWRMKLGRCLVGRPVRQALALDTLKSKSRPFPIGNPEAGPVIVAKFKFSQVALQVLLAAKAVSALHAALEHTKEILDRVSRLTVFADIEAALIGAMLDRLVSGKFAANLRVERAFIGVQFR